MMDRAESAHPHQPSAALQQYSLRFFLRGKYLLR
jgi:hypothetical protein